MHPIRILMLTGAGFCLVLAAGSLLAGVKGKSPLHRRAFLVLAAASLVLGVQVSLHALALISGTAFLALSIPAWALLLWFSMLWKRAQRTGEPKSSA